jgi:hypothetical protein
VKNSAVDAFLDHASARGANLLGQPVNLVGAVDHHADGEPDASGARVGIGVRVVGELGVREQGLARCREARRTRTRRRP